MNDIPEDRRGIAPGLVDSCNPATAATEGRRAQCERSCLDFQGEALSTCVYVASITEATDSISPTNTSMVPKSQGKEAAAEGQGRCLGVGAESVGLRDSSSSSNNS